MSYKPLETIQFWNDALAFWRRQAIALCTVYDFYLDNYEQTEKTHYLDLASNLAQSIESALAQIDELVNRLNALEIEAGY